MDDPRRERTFWAHYGMESVFPLVAGTEDGREGVVGMLLLGPKRNGRPFDKEDFELVSTLANQVALAVETAAAFEEIRHQKTTLARLVAGIVHEVNTPLGAFRSSHDTISRTLRRLSEAVSKGGLQTAADRDQALQWLEAARQLTETSETLTMLLTITAAIALLVAGLGIMNIMLVSVTERTREIGIRKAVGAKRRNILLQFLLEATTISGIGGLIGIGVGIGTSKLLSGSITMNNSTIETYITPDTIIIAFLVAVAVGVVAGVYPAYRASRLNPIDALRYE